MDQSTTAQSIFEADVSKLTISPRLVSYDPNEIERTTSPLSSTSSVYQTHPASPPPQLFEPLDYRKDWSKEIMNTFSVTTIVPKLRNISTMTQAIWWRKYVMHTCHQSTGYCSHIEDPYVKTKGVARKGLNGKAAAISLPRWHERTTDNTGTL